MQNESFYFPPCKPLTKSGLTKCQRFTVDHFLFLLLFYTHNPRKILPFYSLTPNGNETKLSKNKNTIRISSKKQPSLVCCVSGVTPGAECIIGYACAGVDCSFPALAVNVPFGERTTSERLNHIISISYLKTGTTHGARNKRAREQPSNRCCSYFPLGGNIVYHFIGFALTELFFVVLFRTLLFQNALPTSSLAMMVDASIRTDSVTVWRTVHEAKTNRTVVSVRG